MEHQVFKLGAAVLVEADNLAVKHAVCSSERSGHLCREVTKGCEGVPVARHEATFAALDVGEGAEAVEL